MDFFDTITGSPCANCESAPAEDGGHFCEDECRKEYEGEGEYGDD